MGSVHPVRNTRGTSWEWNSYLQEKMSAGFFCAAISGEEVTFKNTLLCLSLRNIRTVCISCFSGVCPTKVLLVNHTTLPPVSNLLMRLLPVDSEELCEKEGTLPTQGLHNRRGKKSKTKSGRG